VVKTAVGRDLLNAIDKLRDGELNFFSPIDTGANSNLDIQETLQRSQAFEKGLQQSEGRFRAIVDATLEFDATLIHVNAAGLEMIGASSLEAIVGKSVHDMLVPEDRERFRVFLERICGGEKSSLKFEITDLPGIRRLMETHAVPLLQPDGKIFQLAVTRDVTSNRSASAPLHCCPQSWIHRMTRSSAKISMALSLAGIEAPSACLATLRKKPWVEALS